MTTANNLVIYTNVKKVADERICPICTEEAPADETHHPHYGGICCYSCRAFFRRAHQRTKTPEFHCKREGKCVIVPKNKQTCKKCRYQKCLDIGMDSKWVLTNAEKRVRFKNYFKKKDELASMRGSEGEAQSQLPTTSHERQTSNVEAGEPSSKKQRLNNEQTETESEFKVLASHRTLLEERNIPVLEELHKVLPSCKQVPSSPPFIQPTTSGAFPRIKKEKKSDIYSSQCSQGKMCYSPQMSKLFPSLPRNEWEIPVTPFDEPQIPQTQFRPLERVDSPDYPPNPVPLFNRNLLNFVLANRFMSGVTQQNFVQNQQEKWQQNMQRIQGYQSFDNYQNLGPVSAPYMQRPPYINEAVNYGQYYPPDNLWQEMFASQGQACQNRSFSSAKPEPVLEKSLSGDLFYNTKSKMSPPFNSSFDSESTPKEKVKSESWNNRFLSPRAQLSTILDAFTLITGKLSLSSDLTQDLISIHQRMKPLEKTTIIAQLSTIAAMLTEFASSQFLFKSLCKEDQVTLLKNNIPLYLQYVMARYFSAETGIEQLNWILEGQFTIESIEEISNLRRISIKEFNSTVNLFPNTEAAELYSRLSENTGMFYPFPQHCSGLIANMLLFHIDDSMVEEVKESKRISCIFEEAKELVRMSFEHLEKTYYINSGSNVGPLIHTLSKMKAIFGLCKVHSDGNELSRTIPKTVHINFTDVEDNWLKLQFTQFQSDFISVTPPRDYFEDLVNVLKFGKPVGVTFVRSYIGMITERVRRVLKSHPEFNNLPDRDQEAIWSKNHKSAIALATARINLQKTGKDMLKSAVGVLCSNDKEWETQFRDCIDLDTLKASYIYEPEINLGRLDEPSINCFQEMMKEISEMCLNDQTYQLFTILSLLDTDGVPYSPTLTGVLKMRQIYLKLFQRKLHAVGCSFIDYASFRKTLQKVRIFSTLMETFME